MPIIEFHGGPLNGERREVPELPIQLCMMEPENLRLVSSYATPWMSRSKCAPSCIAASESIASSTSGVTTS
jgi:hypothetical protein